MCSPPGRMTFSLFLLLSVIICFSDCLPVGNSSQTHRRVNKANVKFPINQKTSTVRSPPGGWARDKNTTSRIAAVEEQFVFPTDDDAEPPKSSTQKVVPRFKPMSSKRSPACAEGSTFCESVDDYPENYLENILQNAIDGFQDLLGTDEIKSSSIEQRFDNNAGNENPLCASIEQIVYPKTAKTKDDKWLYVVNQASHVQGVRIEKCLKTNDGPTQSCFFTESFPIGYKTSCKQKYIYRKLVALDEEGKPITDIFQLPSCCACSVINDSITSRRGAIRKALTSTNATTSTTTSKPK